MNEVKARPGIANIRSRLEHCPNEYRLALLVATGFWLIYLAFLPPGIYSLDGNSMLAVAESLVTHHSFEVPNELGIPGAGGRIYSWWYPLLSILAVPSTYAALLMSHLTGLPFHYLAAILALPLTGALTAATAGMVALLAFRMGATLEGAWLASLSFGFGTVALVYARTFFADPLLAFITVSALYFALGRTRISVLTAACFAALAMVAKPAGIVVGPILAAYLIAKRVPLFRSILPLAGTGVGFSIYAGYNFVRFGQPLNFGIAWPFRLVHILPGFAGLLAGPGWGLLWYCPAVVLAIFGFRKAVKERLFEALAIVMVFAAFLFLHASAWYRLAGWSWGPRYLLPGIPGLCALIGLLERSWKKAVVVLTLLGFMVNAPTLFSFYERHYAELAAQGIPDYNIAWSVRYAPFLHAWPAAFHQVRDARRSDVKQIFERRGIPSKTIEESRALRVVAVWWWVLPLVGVPRWGGFVVAMILVALGCFMLVRAARATALHQGFAPSRGAT